MMRDGVRRYMVESRRYYAEVFDNYIYDYIYAETEEDAVELYKQWLIDNGCDPEEVEDMEFRVKEVEVI